MKKLVLAVASVVAAVTICEQNLPGTDIITQRISLHSQIGFQIKFLEALMRRLDNTNQPSVSTSSK